MTAVRIAGALDARIIAELLNAVIKAGGTTAMTNPVTTDELGQYIARSQRAVWLVAEDGAGALLGVQWIEQSDDLPADTADIATFAHIGKTGLGTGSALFEKIKPLARRQNFRWISAEIRADNAGGLAFYQSRGFEDYGRKPAQRLPNGRVVDKVLKLYRL